MLPGGFPLRCHGREGTKPLSVLCRNKEVWTPGIHSHPRFPTPPRAIFSLESNHLILIWDESPPHICRGAGGKEGCGDGGGRVHLYERSRMNLYTNHFCCSPFFTHSCSPLPPVYSEPLSSSAISHASHAQCSFRNLHSWPAPEYVVLPQCASVILAGWVPWPDNNRKRPDLKLKGTHKDLLGIWLQLQGTTTPIPILTLPYQTGRQGAGYWEKKCPRPDWLQGPRSDWWEGNSSSSLVLFGSCS